MVKVEEKEEVEVCPEIPATYIDSLPNGKQEISEEISE